MIPGPLSLWIGLPSLFSKVPTLGMSFYKDWNNIIPFSTIFFCNCIVEHTASAPSTYFACFFLVSSEPDCNSFEKVMQDLIYLCSQDPFLNLIQTMLLMHHLVLSVSLLFLNIYLSLSFVCFLNRLKCSEGKSKFFTAL